LDSFITKKNNLKTKKKFHASWAGLTLKMQIGSKIGTLNEHFVIFHHIFLVFVEKLTISFIIEATRVKLMKKKKKNNFLPCFTQNVAKTVLTHFLSNLNLKDPSQDVGSNIF
jgi:hypothetical protein